MDNTIAEKLFKSLDIILDKRLASLTFDKTIICTITEVPDKTLNSNIYKVSDGSTIFEVCGDDNAGYKINDKVRVNIFGSSKEDKYIIGKYNSESNRSMKYVPPINKMINLENNIIDSIIGEMKIYPNENITEQEIAKLKNLNKSLQINDIYNTLSISADFITSFPNSVIKGNYGLIIKIYFDDDSQTDAVAMFGQNEFLGNPYNFIIPSKQTNTFDLSNNKGNIITDIRVSLYQMNDFKILDENNEEQILDNQDNNNFIEVKNLIVNLGTDVSSLPDNTVIISSDKSLDYNGTEQSDLTRNLSLLWSNKTSDDEYIGFGDGYTNVTDEKIDNNYNEIIYINNKTEGGSEFDENKYANRYSILWYIKDVLYEVVDNPEPFYEKGWRPVNEHQNINYGLPIEDDYIDLGDSVYKYKVSLNNPTQQVTIKLPANKTDVEYKAILFYNHEKYTSNILKFTNNQPDVESQVAENIKQIEIQHGENSQLDYKLYSEDGYLINSINRLVDRKLNFVFTDIKGVDSSLQGATILWKVPKYSTMISGYANNGYEQATKEDEYFDSEYNIFFKTIPVDAETANTNFTYRIASFYSPSLVNNSITCEIIKGELKYSDSIHFNFSKFGTNGTNYTLTAIPYEEKNALVLNSNDFTVYQNPCYWIRLYDYEGKEIEINNDIEISWIGNLTIFSESKREGSNNIIDFSLNTTLPFNQEELLHNFTGICKITVPVLIDNDNSQKTYKLSTYISIPISIGTDQQIEGATQIVYNNYGINPYYYPNPYKLYKNNQPQNVTWELAHYNEQGQQIYDQNTTLAEDEFVYQVLPKLNNDILSPYTMYLNDFNYYTLVYCVDSNENLLWIQPIHIKQNRFEFQALNEWNGSYTTEDGKIFADMLAVGKKDSSNQFTGMLMGQYEDKNSKKLYGLYGYKDGIQTFGLKEDGTAFLGSSNTGRIEFDGNKGIIESGNYDETSGMQINLSNGHIDAYDFKLTSKNITLISNPKNDESYISINGDAFQLTADGGLTINTKNFSTSSTSGGKTTIGGWNVDNNSFYSGTGDFANANVFLCNTGSTSEFNISGSGYKDGWVFKAGENFGVDTEGHMFASQGKIANWDISTNMLSYGSNKDILLCPAGTLEQYTVANYTEKNWVFKAGENFGIQDNGVMYCQNAVINSSNQNADYPISYSSSFIKYEDNQHPDLEQGYQTFEANSSIDLKTEIEDKLTGQDYTFAWSSQDLQHSLLTYLKIGIFTNELLGIGYRTPSIKMGVKGVTVEYNNPTIWGQVDETILEIKPSGGYLLGDWYSDNGSINVTSSVSTDSDLRVKNSIIEIYDTYNTFFNNLNPVIYKYNNGTSNRFHTGFIAQHVKDALDIAGLTTQDFAGLTIEAAGTENEIWRLRYEEFIALNTWKIQQQAREIEQLKEEIKELKLLL